MSDNRSSSSSRSRRIASAEAEEWPPAKIFFRDVIETDDNCKDTNATLSKEEAEEPPFAFRFGDAIVGIARRSVSCGRSRSEVLHTTCGCGHDLDPDCPDDELDPGEEFYGPHRGPSRRLWRSAGDAYPPPSHDEDSLLDSLSLCSDSTLDTVLDETEFRETQKLHRMSSPSSVLPSNTLSEDAWDEAAQLIRFTPSDVTCLSANGAFYLDDESDVLHDTATTRPTETRRRRRVVRFQHPPVTSLKQRPKTSSEEVPALFFTETELNQITEDRRCRNRGDDVEIVATVLPQVQSNADVVKGVHRRLPSDRSWIDLPVPKSGSLDLDPRAGGAPQEEEKENHSNLCISVSFNQKVRRRRRRRRDGDRSYEKIVDPSELIEC